MDHFTISKIGNFLRNMDVISYHELLHCSIQGNYLYLGTDQGLTKIENEMCQKLR